MYEKYATKAFVIDMRSSKEADRIVLMYSKDFGLIQVLFTGVRNIQSKFKGFLDIGNFISVTLVKGKSVWRATDVSALGSFSTFKTNREVFLRSLSLLKSMVHGEEKNESLFESLEESFLFLQKRLHSQETLSALECLVSIRMLKALGYSKGGYPNVELSGVIKEHDLLSLVQYKQDVIKDINSSIQASQLV